MNLQTLTIIEARKKLRAHDISATELTTEFIQHIKSIDPKVTAFLTTTEIKALQCAKELDDSGDMNKKLFGIPIALKDIIVTKGIKTTAGSKMLENYIPPFSATVATKLHDVGSIMMGKTNMDEFAMGSSNENSAYFPSKNPWDVTRVPGGSSGGSAVAVSSSMVLASLGTDTGGSIRQPASLCGVVGMKPTYGRVSRFGVIPMASSLDQVGPFTKTVEDCAIMMEILAGKDPYDATTLPASVPSYATNLSSDIKGKKIGIPKEYFAEGLDAEDANVIQNSIELLKQKGAIIQEISLPHTKYALSVYYLVMASEVSSNLARYDGIRYCVSPDDMHVKNLDDIYLQTKSNGFGAEPKRRIMLGTFALSAGYEDKYYQQAQKVRTLIKRDFDEAFAQLDAIVTPTSPTTAWKFGDKMDDPLKMYLSDVYTIPANLAGICGLVVPVGFSHSLPVGLQILGNQLEEQSILNIGYALDQEIEFYKNVPSVLEQK